MCWAVVHLRCKQSLACSIRPLATPLARMLSISHSCSAFLHFVASHVSVESLKLLFVYSNVSPIHLPTQRLWCVLFIHILKFQNESFFSKLILFQSEFLYFISTLGYSFGVVCVSVRVWVWGCACDCAGVGMGLCV